MANYTAQEWGNSFYITGTKEELNKASMEKETTQKLDALDIIFSCPLWPERYKLPIQAYPLYDALHSTAKQYALAIAKEDWKEALRIASDWSIHVKFMLDTVRMSDSKPCRKLLSVYKYYVDAAGTNMGSIQKLV